MALLATIPRPLHLVVALDWAPNGLVRSAIELGCRLLAWPAVIRTDAIRHQRTAYRPDEATRYNRRAVREAVRLLRAGQVVAIFPEAYPNIDPAFTPKLGDEQLPFRDGFARLADIASKDGSVAVIPAGLHYERAAPWNVTLRYGEPIVIDGPEDGLDLRTVAEARVRALSGAS
jgi:putative membrane protein